jgi:hypothetical protein
MSTRAHTKPIGIAVDTDRVWSWRRAIVFMIVTALAAWGGTLLVGYAVKTLVDGLA